MENIARRRMFWWLVVSQVVYLISVLAWFMVSAFSVMMFDAPGSEENIKLLSLYYAIQVYPVALILSSVCSWIFYRKNKYKGSLLWNALPLIWILPLVAIFVYANIFD